MARIGFIGLGNMGLPMALNLVKAGHQVTGFDLAAAAIEKLVAGGGKAAREAVGVASDAEVVITMLPSGKEARAIYLGSDGLVEKVAAGTLLIDCSTIDVQSARSLASAAEAQGLTMVDAPTSGGVGAAQAAKLTQKEAGPLTVYDPNPVAIRLADGRMRLVNQ